jgi:transcription initiation factor TFIIH subunit 2
MVDYFAHNPISQLGVIITRNAQAEKLTELSANQRAHIEALGNDHRLVPAGDASLQNALDMACSLLRDIPEYGFREVMVVYGSLASRDPGDIFATMQKLRKHHIRVSVVGLAAEVHVLRTLVDRTGRHARCSTEYRTL